MPEIVKVETEDGHCEARFFTSGAAPRPGIVFYMDGLAIRQALLDMARRLAGLGYAVLLPDMYYRDVPYAPFDAKATFDDPVEHRRLLSLVNGLSNSRMRTDVAAMIGWMTTNDRIADPIGAVGYCIGGRAALLSAAVSSRVKGVAAIHGAGIVTEASDSAHLSVLSRQAAVYVAVAGIDQYFSSDEERRLAYALREGAVDHIIENYRGAAHGFAIDDARYYHRDAAERHWRRLETFFAETLQS